MTTYRSFLGNAFDRTICDVIYEIQECRKQHNYALLDTQVEEIRTYAQRMEDKLWKYRQVFRGEDDHELKELEESRKKLKDEIFALQAIKYDLKKGTPNAKEEAKKTEAEAASKT